MAIGKGDKIKLHYAGMLEDGKVFDTTEGKEPLVLEAGKGAVIDGIEEALIGMEYGVWKEVIITPAKAYGPVKDSLQQTISIDTIKQAGRTPEIGMLVDIMDEEGKKMQGIVIKIGEKNVLADFNHPLAGRTLKFRLMAERKL